MLLADESRPVWVAVMLLRCAREYPPRAGGGWAKRKGDLSISSSSTSSSHIRKPVYARKHTSHRASVSAFPVLQFHVPGAEAHIHCRINPTNPRRISLDKAAKLLFPWTRSAGYVAFCFGRHHLSPSIVSQDKG